MPTPSILNNVGLPVIVTDRIYSNKSYKPSCFYVFGLISVALHDLR